MITLTNFESGEILIAEGGCSVRLTREQANRLVMAARMHPVAEFMDKLPSLVPGEFLEKIRTTFERGGGSRRWTLKERFARLQTLSGDYSSSQPDRIVEVVHWEKM